MKKSVMYAGAAVLIVGLLAGSTFAGNGKGTQDRKQTKICVCPIFMDVKPMDGVCDLCGGCIPLRDGTKSGDRDQIRKRDGSCLMASSDITVAATEMMASKGKGGNGKGQGDCTRKRDGSCDGTGKGQGKGAGKGKGACKRDGSCAIQPNS